MQTCRIGWIRKFNIGIFLSYHPDARQSLVPLSHPKVVGKWFNAFDSRDVVALYPLDRDRFNIAQRCQPRLSAFLRRGS